MKTRTVYVGAVIALAGLLCFGPVTAVGVKKVDSKVKITEGGPSHFEGKVTSDKRKCIKNRDVTLKYSSGARKGQVAYETTTDAKGLWEIDAVFNAGVYQAIAHRLVFDSFVCVGTRNLRHEF